MKKYKQPNVLLAGKTTSVVPIALGAAALSVGGAFAVGVASGLMKDKKFPAQKVGSLTAVTVCS